MQVIKAREAKNGRFFRGNLQDAAVVARATDNYRALKKRLTHSQQGHCTHTVRTLRALLLFMALPPTRT